MWKREEFFFKDTTAAAIASAFVYGWRTKLKFSTHRVVNQLHDIWSLRQLLSQMQLLVLLLLPLCLKLRNTNPFAAHCHGACSVSTSSSRSRRSQCCSTIASCWSGTSTRGPRPPAVTAAVAGTSDFEALFVEHHSARWTVNTLQNCVKIAPW